MIRRIPTHTYFLRAISPDSLYLLCLTYIELPLNDPGFNEGYIFMIPTKW